MTATLKTAHLSVALALLAGLPLQSRAHDDEQVIARDDFGHRAIRVDGRFEDVSAFATPLPLGDRAGVNVPLGFSFTHYGQTHTSVGVTSEGYLTFGGSVSNVPQAIPDPATPNAVIAPFWANLDVTKNGSARVTYATLGSAPARRFVVQWTDVPFAADNAARLTFQVALHEGTQAVEFHWVQMPSLGPGPIATCSEICHSRKWLTRQAQR